MRADCGHEIVSNGFSTGYATSRSTGQTLCYPCANEAQRADMISAQSFMAYLSSDGSTVTSWSGGKLGTVLRETVRKGVGFSPDGRTYLRVIDCRGKQWHGNGPGRGMYVRLRASK